MRTVLLLLVGLSRLMAADAARDERWRQDLDSLATQLATQHPNLFFQTPRSVFDAAVSGLRNTIPDLSDAEVIIGLARITALPGDGHTSLSLNQVTGTFRKLPLEFRWFEDGLFVTVAGLNYTRALGCKVIQIGDRTAEEAHRAVRTLVSYENDIYVREIGPTYLVNADVLRAVKIAPSTDSVRFVLEERSGNRFTLDVASVEPGTGVRAAGAPDSTTGFIPYYRQQTNQNYWFKYIESSRTLYFAYNACVEQPGLPFAQFNSQLWAVFDAQPVERVILDLRNNSGGSDLVLDPFLAAAAARAARFLSAKPVVIIGKRSYSSAVGNAIMLHQGPVMLLGEPSGGSPNGYGQVKHLTLPNSKLDVICSTKYFYYPNLPEGSLMPDVIVPFYSSDWFARHDPFLAAALAGVAPEPGTFTKTSAVTVLNAAGFRSNAPVAPGSLAAAFGDFSGVTTTDAPAVPLPKQLNGVQVLVNGTAAPLIAVRAGQINFQVPAATLPGDAAIRIQRNGSDLATGTMQVAATAPGLFVADPLSIASPGAVLDQGGRVMQIYASGQGATDPAVDDGAAPGAQPVAHSKAVPRVYFAGELAEVLFSGLNPEFPGLWQINVHVPVGAALSGQTPVFVVLGSKISNAVSVAVN